MRKIGSMLLFLVILLLSVIPAFAQERPSVLEVLENDADGRFTTLLAAIDAAGLREALEGEGPFTVLAPTNDAFTAALEVMGVTPEQALMLGDGLQPILLMHVIEGRYFFRNLTGGPTLDTLAGEAVTFNLTDGVFTVNGVGISDPDQLASNGIVHAIDGVIVPEAMMAMMQPAPEATPEETPAPVVEAPTRPTLAELLTADGEGRFTTLLAAVDAAGLTDALNGEGPLTVLAPTNDAFAAALDYLGVSADDLMEDPEMLAQILSYHVIPGQYFFRNLTAGPALETLTGETVQFDLTDGLFTVNGVRISDPDQLASNGIFHVIGGVLLPADIQAAADANRAHVRFIHLSPDFGAAEIYADGVLVVEGVEYGVASEWIEIAGGVLRVGVAPEPGARANNTGIGRVEAGSYVSVVVVGSGSSIRIRYIVEDYTAPAEGRARVSVLQSVQNLGAIDVLANGELFIGALGYPGSLGDNDGVDTRDVPAATYNITVNQAGTTNLIVEGGNFTFDAGGNYLIVTGGAPGNVILFVYSTEPAPAE